MKKLFLLALPLFIFACKPSVEAHKAAIEELGTNWDKATNALTDLSNGLTKDMTGFTESASTFMLDSAATAALKGDAATKWKEAVTNFKSSTTDAFTPLQGEMGDFVKMWMENSAKVTALKDGLAAGKIEGDVPAQITELTGLVTQANDKITAWTAKKSELAAAANTAVESLKTAYAAATKK